MSKAEFTPDELLWLSALAKCDGKCSSADLTEKTGLTAERAADIEQNFVKTLLAYRPSPGIVRLTADGKELVAGMAL